MVAVVTGATGHLGAALVRALVERGARVRAVVRCCDHEALRGLDIERVVGDVLSYDSLWHAFEGAEVVYHLAGVISIAGDPDGTVAAVNVDGAENAARAARVRAVRRFVHVSSVHAFDTAAASDAVTEALPLCEQDSRRHSAYARSKAEGERRVRHSAGEELDVVVVHPTGVIGPWDFGPSRMGQVFLKLYDRRLPGLVAGGFDFVDVRDVAIGMVAACDRGRPGDRYLLSGTHVSLSQLARAAQAVTGVRRPRLTAPMWLARIGAPLVHRMARMSGQEPLYTSESLAALRGCARVDASKARAELGYEPRPLDDTVRDIYQWFANRGRIAGMAGDEEGTP